MNIYFKIVKKKTLDMYYVCTIYSSRAEKQDNNGQNLSH